MIPFLHRAPIQKDNPLWLVVLADMMTNLMLFFLVLFALSRQEPKARQDLARTFDAAHLIDRSKTGAPEPNPREFQENRAADKLKSMFADVAVTEHIIRVRLQDQLLFASAQASLSSAAAERIKNLAKVLKEMPNEVIVEGHTDNVPLMTPPYRSNWELSVARSYSVIERLVEEGLPPLRLVTAGYGEYHPIGANETPSGRARNRRVEIIILRDKKGKKS